MADIQISIAGAGAEDAAADLFNIDGIDGTYQVNDEVSKDGTLAVVASVVGITVGAMTIGEKLHKWYNSYQTQDTQQRIEQVLIVTPTSRLLLEGASIQEITDALKPLAK